MRGNIRLVDGEHYHKKNKQFWLRARENPNFSHEQKIRITQNHIHNISKSWVNSILSLSPDAVIEPKNETEIQDQKAAELNHSVWMDVKKRQRMEQKKAELAADFFDLGEAAVKIFFDASAGEIAGYEPLTYEDGTPVVDQMTGQVQQSEIPVFSGEIKIERVLASNLFRDTSARSKYDCRMVGIRKMVDVKELKKQVGSDEEKLKFIKADSDDTFKVFSEINSDYEESKDQALVKEYYFRPGAEFPNGYFYITTTSGILFEGELPFGIFPLAWEGFDDIQASCRSRSLIKQLRPFQAEINRAISQMAMIQMTNGEDKIFMQAGAKMSAAQYVPGVRAFTISGMAPTVVQGRTGEQFMGYVNFQIEQMYQAAKLQELAMPADGNVAPYAMLYASAKQRRAFSLYAAKFGRFLVEICEITLKLAKAYYNEQNLIPAIGRNEAINISEFKNSNPLSYEVTVEEGSDDIESRLGKQMSLTQFMQYGGKNLTAEQLGIIAREMPYMNSEAITSSLTLNYDVSKNVILALDRGQVPKISKYNDNPYLIQRLSARQQQGDFNMLPPQIQHNYEMFMQQLDQIEVQKQQDIQRAEAGFIPTTGPLVPCDFYVNTQNGGTQRVKIYSDAIKWLLDSLEKQGTYLGQIKDTNEGALADMARMHGQPQQQPPQGMGPPGNGMPPMMPQMNQGGSHGY